MNQHIVQFARDAGAVIRPLVHAQIDISHELPDTQLVSHPQRNTQGCAEGTEAIRIAPGA
jgi:hypothetical protein